MGGTRFLTVLLVLLTTFVISPFFYGHPVAGVILRVLLSILLISAAYACAEERRALIIASSLAVPALIAQWIGYFTSGSEFVLAGHTFIILFLAYIIRVILKHIIRARRVTADVIYGAVCVYLLIGLLWAVFYSVLEIAQPDSFGARALDVRNSDLASPQPVPLYRLVYYSLVTLTTLGYGDIAPVTPPAQLASSLEAVIGQLYLAILIAGLVGLRVSQRRE